MSLRSFPVILLTALSAAGSTSPSQSTSYEGSTALVFFPPEAPVYGASIIERANDPRVSSGGRRPAAPEGLAEFVGDTLYPAISTRLHADEVSRTLSSRLENYRARRNALTNALLDHCQLLHEADDATREREFKAFAAVQTPSIVALEALAEVLRRDLTRGVLGLNTGWNARRTWKLDSLPAGRDAMHREAEFQVMRAAAFYDDGLSPAQRGMLREAAIELDRTARTLGDRSERMSSSDAMFFSPETARVRLPPRLPPELLHRIGRYNGEKAALKQELRDLVLKLEHAPHAERASALAKLADTQWPRHSELENLAEDLRRDLAPYFVPAPPPKTPLPHGLLVTIQSYNDDRDSYYAALRRKVLEAAAKVPRYDGSRELTPDFDNNEDFSARRHAAAKVAIAAFQEEQRDRIAKLEVRFMAIREALQSIASTTRDPETGRLLTVDGLLRQHVATMAKFDEYGRTSTMYLYYRIALFQPGLSPEQRRLLFGHAVGCLAQPLPPGEPLPRRSMKYPIARPNS